MYINAVTDSVMLQTYTHDMVFIRLFIKSNKIKSIQSLKVTAPTMTNSVHEPQ